MRWRTLFRYSRPSHPHLYITSLPPSQQKTEEAEKVQQLVGSLQEHIEELCPREQLQKMEEELREREAVLEVSLRVHVHVCVCLCLSVCLSVHLSLSLSTCLVACLSVCLLSACLSVCLSVSVCVSVCCPLHDLALSVQEKNSELVSLRKEVSTLNQNLVMCSEVSPSQRSLHGQTHMYSTWSPPPPSLPLPPPLPLPLHPGLPR